METIIRKLLIILFVNVSVISNAQTNPFGLVYQGAITKNEIAAPRNLPKNIPPGAHSSILATPAASNDGLSIRGVMMSSTNEEIIFPNAPPIMTATAKSSTLPFMINSLNSLIIPLNIVVVS